jgi:hypothetical protein
MYSSQVSSSNAVIAVVVELVGQTQLVQAIVSDDDDTPQHSSSEHSSHSQHYTMSPPPDLEHAKDKNTNRTTETGRLPIPVSRDCQMESRSTCPHLQYSQHRQKWNEQDDDEDDVSVKNWDGRCRKIEMTLKRLRRMQKML